MTEFTRYWVCLIYALICNHVEINVGQVIFSAMKKAHYQSGRCYSFEGLLTQILRRHTVDKEELDYKPDIVTRLVDIKTARSTTGAQGPVLTMAERQVWADKISAWMFGL